VPIYRGTRRRDRARIGAVSAEVENLRLGVYTVPEASRLTRIAPARIRRWVRGYSFGESGHSPPVWQRQLPDVDGKLALGFKDLMELRFVNAFLEQGVTWKKLRQSAEQAANLVGSTHPFSTRRFKTDGKQIFAHLAEGAAEPLMDLLLKQQVIYAVVAPRLFAGVEFDDNEPLRWWPLGLQRRVVLDPLKQFGHSVVVPSNVPTTVLANAVRLEESAERVARLYEVDIKAVRDAVEWERRLAA
jgi:uncharacterized protein (DUF433 family)